MLKQREQKIHTKKIIWTGRNKTTLKNTKTKIQQKTQQKKQQQFQCPDDKA